MVRRKSQFWRLAASLLAVTGLLGHGLAMLLVAVLAASPAAADQPGFGTICSAVGTSDSAPEDRHPAGSPNPCPVCTAFAQASAADLPSAVLLPLQRSTTAGLTPRRWGEMLTAVIRAASPRAPPTV